MPPVVSAASAPHPLVAAVREFVEREVRPAAPALEHADRYPHALVDRMRELGLFGALVPAAWGGLGLDVATYARIIEELCRGWMSLAGVINSHTMAALIVLHHGTDEQRARLLPRFARGEARGGLCLTEPQAGSDVQAIRTTARRAGDVYLITGTKMFVTNGREGNTFALLALTAPDATPRHRGMSCFIVEKGHPGLRVVKSISKLGYKGVDTAELVFEDVPVPAANLVGGVEGHGFKHVMSGLETGRINVAARAVGVAQAALERSLEGVRPGPPARRQGPAGRGEAPPPAAGARAAHGAVADLAARLASARLLTAWAAGLKDRGERCDLEAGMAKLWASETAQAAALAALRLHGDAGRRLALDLERLYRDTPLMIIGEGTNEIQRVVIARQLVERYGERPAPLVSREAEPEERRRIVLTVRQFVDKVVTPAAGEEEAAGRYPAELLGGLWQLGVAGAAVPAAAGGLGLDAVTCTMLVEELARGWTAPASLVGAHLDAARAVAALADAEPREALLRALARGDLLATTALAGSVTARRRGDGWVLDGAVPLVAGAPHAGLFLVEAAAEDGGSVLALARRHTAGLRPGPPEAALGTRGLDPGSLALDGVRVPAGLVLHDAGRVEAVGAFARLGVAATALGLAQAAFEAALRYAQQRTAFGRPICQHQAIQLKLADMATAVTAARLLTYHAAERLDGGAPATAAPGGPAEAAAMAKLLATETACEVALEAMRVHGGYGYTTEFPVERYYRDAPRLLLALGGGEADRERLARRLAGAGRL